MTEIKYDAPTKVQDLNILNTYELEGLAGEVVPKAGYVYIAGG